MRTTTRGLSAGERVHVRGTDLQRAFDGTYVGPKYRDLVEVRSDHNGGVYLVRLGRVRRVGSRKKREAA